VARECDGADRDAANIGCPLQCWRWRRNAGDNPPSGQSWARDHVDWAGLPVNLDFAFSQQKRDKVYAQHLNRKRGAQLWGLLPKTAHVCVCEASAEHLDPEAARDYVR
jgi:hypothetical protein